MKRTPNENVIKEEPQNTPQTLYWPVIDGEVLCGFNCSDNHRGISFTYGDKSNENGSFGNVYAVASGKVIEKSYDSGRLGEYIVIAHDNGDKSLYAHLSVGSSLGVGTRVTEDTVIAHVGMTGKAYYPNVYFEYTSNGNQVDTTKSLIRR
ncbi:MAG: M23 family metallopeptidase [Erysipelothrix sp.]